MGWLVWALVALLVWAGYRYMVGRARKARHMRSVKQQCARVAPTDSIFVLLDGLRDDEAEWMVYALFEQAYCPFRVYVGVVSALPVFAKFQEVARRSPVSARLGDHVRVASRAGGVAALYAQERYVLLLSSALLVERHWDRALVDQIAPQVAIAEFPRVVAYEYAHLNLHQNKANLISRQLQRARAPQPQLPNFPRVQSQPSGAWQLPALTTAPCARMPDKQTPSLFASPEFTFAEAAALPLLIQAEAARGTPLHAHVLTALLVESGWRVVLPQRSLAQRVAPQPWRVGESAAHQLTQGAAFQAYTGIHVAQGFSHGKALLGLSAALEDAEIQVKYGSYAHYQATRARLHPE